MTQTELLEIIANGENSGIEFKRDDVRPEQIARELISMVNLKGGKLLLGVEDNGIISGITRPDNGTERWIMDTVFRRYITPPIIPFYEEVLTDTGRVAIITVGQGSSKPYAVIQNDRPDIYVRVGSTCQLATREQIIRMAQESGLFHAETLPVSGTNQEQIELSLFFDYYFKNYGEDLREAGSDVIQQKTLQLDIIVKTEHQGILSSIAGQILFGKNPGRFLPQHGFRIIHYPGTEPEINAISDESYTIQVASIKNENNEIIMPGLLDSLMAHLQEKLSTEEIAQDGFTRVRNWIYPEEILRELIVNAIIHRDYTKANRNEVLIYSDRIEIISYGSLPNTLTIEKIKAGHKYPRNPILVRIAQDYGFMDHRGLGIRRKVLPILTERGFNEPDFEATEDFFKITINKI